MRSRPAVNPTAGGDRDQRPTSFEVYQNYPNPFNPSTVIEFALPKQSTVELRVYNVLGQEVATLAHGTYAAGTHTVNFKADNLAGGLYFYRLQAGSYVDVKKMLLIK